MTAKKLLASALLLATFVFPGCNVWNAGLEMLKWRVEEPKKADAPIALANLSGGGTRETQAPGPQAMVPRVTVWRITAPVGTFSGNEKVWSELNEDAMDSKMSVLMAQNGLRAATGNVSRWPVIAKLIEGPGVGNDRQECQTDGRTSLSIVTRPAVTDQIVISIDHDHQQQGRTFEACDNGFKLSMRGIRGKQQLQVQLEPYVALGTVRVQRPDVQLGISPGGFVREESFPDLSMAALLGADQFLVVSPVDPKSNRFSIGSLWLSEIDKVPALETVLIFVPSTGGK